MAAAQPFTGRGVWRVLPPIGYDMVSKCERTGFDPPGHSVVVVDMYVWEIHSNSLLTGYLLCSSFRPLFAIFIYCGSFLLPEFFEFSAVVNDVAAVRIKQCQRRIAIAGI